MEAAAAGGSAAARVSAVSTICTSTLTEAAATEITNIRAVEMLRAAASDAFSSVTNAVWLAEPSLPMAPTSPSREMA